jgi:hypothetical protein
MTRGDNSGVTIAESCVGRLKRRESVMRVRELPASSASLASLCHSSKHIVDLLAVVGGENFKSDKVG